MKLGPSNDSDPNVQLEIKAARSATSDASWETFEWYEECRAGWPWDITKPIAHQWPWGRDPVHDAKGDAMLEETIAVHVPDDDPIVKEPPP